MRTRRVAIIGAGIGGLSAAVDLAAHGLDVEVFERAPTPGGKMREVSLGGARIDAGPTVLTMPWVFEELFAEACARFSDYVTMKPAAILARHAWSADERLDLFADMERSVDAIAAFAGPAEAAGYRTFCGRAQRIFETLDRSFIRAPKPNLAQLIHRIGYYRVRALWSINPYVTLWRALGEHFRDPRLRQLFARYATYCGSSPFHAPATLMLVAHVEKEGVWLVEGGMYRIAAALADLAGSLGVRFRYEAEVAGILTAGGRISGVRLECGETIETDAAVVNGDAAALATGLFGEPAARAVPMPSRRTRALSAVTWSVSAQTHGFPLTRHNVFFTRDYRAEFDDILRRGRVPGDPTVYLCAQDRDDDADAPDGPERLLIVINAPPNGDTTAMTQSERETCEERTFALLERCGLTVIREPDRMLMTTPADFERLFPATGGALYGRASHGWIASFRRPGSRTRVPGLYLAGGSTHPGAGVPMAAISGRLAASSLIADLASTYPSHLVAMPGGISMRSARIGALG